MTISNEQKKHCELLLAEMEGGMDEVAMLGANGEVAGRLSRLILGAASPFLRPWLKDDGDVLILPDIPSSWLSAATHRLIHPIIRLHKEEVQCLLEVSYQLGINLCISPKETVPDETVSDVTYVRDEILHEEDESLEKIQNGDIEITQDSVPEQCLSVCESSGFTLCCSPRVLVTDLEENISNRCQIQADISCDDCKQNFISLELLALHCKDVHGENEGSGNLQQLLIGQEYVYTITGDPGDSLAKKVPREEDKRFPCQQCEKHFGTRVQLKHHMNIHLGLKPYVCGVCGKGFTQPTHLSVHRRTHNGARPYMCSTCGKTFAIASNMRKHVAIHERDTLDLINVEAAMDENCNNPLPPEILPFPCNYCQDRFESLKKLSIHERREHGKQHFCPHSGCNRICASASQLSKHQLTHTGEKPHSCHICNKAFTQKSHMTHHVATVHVEPGQREKSHVCSQCGRCFVSKGVLAKHMMLHTNQRPHKCQVCNKAFVQKSHLKVHMNHHTGERPFSCQECEKNFTTKQHLKEHCKLHTDSKPWLACSQCSARYRGQADLTIHMRRHTGETPFPCTECKKQFRSERSLENHKRVHSGSKPFQCYQCDKRFTTPSGLRQHFKHNQRCREAAKPGSFSTKRNVELITVEEIGINNQRNNSRKKVTPFNEADVNNAVWLQSS